MRVVADLVQAKPPDEVDARTAANRRRQATAIIVVALIALLVVAGLTTPSFLYRREYAGGDTERPSVTGVKSRLVCPMSPYPAHLFALSAEELSILAACVFGWLMRASFGLPLSLS